VIDHYDWAGGREAMIRFGPADGPIVVMTLPLFEEANRTRTFSVSVLRGLAEHGIGGVLPDLPGQGESPIELEEISPSNWTEALSSVSSRLGCAVHLAAIRGGALIAGTVSALSHWYFAPASGQALVRDLVRARQLADRETGQSFDAATIAEDGPPIDLLGNRVPRPLLCALMAAEPDLAPPCRVVRLDGDAAPADRHVAGAPLWRRAEPDNDAGLATTLAADLAEWVHRCAR
jgi:hypothetical protein